MLKLHFTFILHVFVQFFSILFYSSHHIPHLPYSLCNTEMSKKQQKKNIKVKQTQHTIFSNSIHIAHKSLPQFSIKTIFSSFFHFCFHISLHLCTHKYRFFCCCFCLCLSCTIMVNVHIQSLLFEISCIQILFEDCNR